jgi:hypothetical protein
MQSQLSYVSSELDVRPQRAGAPEDRATARTFGRIPTYSFIEFPHTVATTRPSPNRMFPEFMRPCDLCKRNSFCDLEPLPPRRKGVVQIPRRRHPCLGREIITPQVEHADILEYHQPERDLRCRVISGVRTGNEAGVLGELWCPFSIQETPDS